jgi:hypothetical protein
VQNAGGTPGTTKDMLRWQRLRFGFGATLSDRVIVL